MDGLNDPKLVSRKLKLPIILRFTRLYFFVVLGMSTISHLWMGKMEESVHHHHQKQVSCKDNLIQKYETAELEGHHIVNMADKNCREDPDVFHCLLKCHQ